MGEEWTQICEELGDGVVDEKITKDLFWKMYDEMHAGDVDEHYSKVLANAETSQPPPNEGASESMENQEISQVEADQEDLLAKDNQDLSNNTEPEASKTSADRDKEAERM